MPFDFAKTQAQKNRFDSKNKLKKTERCFPLLNRYYQNYGIRALYKGWQFRALQYFFNSVVTCGTLDFFERKIKDLS